MEKNNYTFLKRLNKSKTAYLFILPLMFFLITFSYYPAFSGIVHSFFEWSEIKSEFIGFNNYIELFSDKDVFWPSMLTMVKIMVPKLIISIVVPLVVAAILFNIKSESLVSKYRFLVLVPMVAPGVVSVLIWEYIYDPNYGLVSAIYKLFGGEVVAWIDDSRTVIPAIIFMGFPWIGGTSVLIYLSGFSGINPSIRESARIDGATTKRIFFSIDLPLIMGQVRYFLIMGLINGIQDYSVQFLITDGGPGYDTMVPGYLMYKQAFTAGRMGYACAIGTILSIVIMALTIIIFKTSKKEADN